MAAPNTHTYAQIRARVALLPAAKFIPLSRPVRPRFVTLGRRSGPAEGQVAFAPKLASICRLGQEKREIKRRTAGLNGFTGRGMRKINS